MMEDVFLPIAIVGMLFIGVPWLIFHYVTQWKRTGSVTVEDEQLMDQLYETARRLEDRLQTIERIIAADHPEFRQLGAQRERDADIRLDQELARAREGGPARPQRGGDHAREQRDEDYRRQRY